MTTEHATPKNKAYEFRICDVHGKTVCVRGIDYSTSLDGALRVWGDDGKFTASPDGWSWIKRTGEIVGGKVVYYE